MMADNLVVPTKLFFNNPRKMLNLGVIDVTAITQNNVAEIHLLSLFPKIMSAKGNPAIGSLVFTDKFVTLGSFFQLLFGAVVDNHASEIGFQP